MKWINSKQTIYTSRVFDKLPDLDEKIWVDTNHGIYKASYTKWNAFDSRSDYEFIVAAPPVPGGYTIFAWMPISNNQPERSKREDSQECEMRCSEHCGNTVRDK